MTEFEIDNIGVVIPLENKNEKNNEITVQHKIESGNDFNMVCVINRGISTSEKAYTSEFVIVALVISMFSLGAITKISTWAKTVIRNIIPNVKANIL